MAKMRGTYSDRYEGLQIKIERKELPSGKCQVKFEAIGLLREDCYGYLLVDGERSLKEVITEIKAKLRKTGGFHNYYQRRLYSLQKGVTPEQGFVIFKSTGHL